GWVEFDEALSAVDDIGPGGDYLGHPHTQENFQTAFFMPEMFDNNSIEQWMAEGSVEITRRALDHARRLLEAYEMPKMDEAADEALLEYIRCREDEIPVASELNQKY
ncbi:MAG: trimethylamine methyltransferase, partial [Gammaproteobacteria bacterium]|nr:trimethylamine methyltransferase [Gammaproteobacteria bacterium]